MRYFAALLAVAITLVGHQNPVLDGRITADEKAGATIIKMSRGGSVYMRRTGELLYAAIESPAPGYGNVCVGNATRVRVLHASAALGDADYVLRDGVWTRLTNFAWVLRDSPRLPAPTDEEKQAHLSSRGWLGTAKNAPATVREFLIRIGSGDERVAFFFIETGPQSHASVAPATVTDACATAQMGGPLPETATFAPVTWHSLK